MGTNYYVSETIDICPHCNSKIKSENVFGYHIGKSSGGWCFALHVDVDAGIKNLEDMNVFLIDKKIIDEYGKSITFEKLLNVIFRIGFRNRNQSEFERHENCVGHGEGPYDYISGEFS